MGNPHSISEATPIMSLESTDLATIIATQDGKKKNTNCKVIAKEDGKNFLIADNTAFLKMKILKEGSNVQKYLVVGNFIRIIDAMYNSNDQAIIVDDSSAIFNGKSISNLILPENDIKIAYQTLSSTFDLNPKQITRGTIMAKVVQIKMNSFKTMFGRRPVKKIALKDVNGHKTFLNIWGSKHENVAEGKVFLFYDLAAESFPKEKPHFLTTTATSTITEAPLNDQVALSNIGLEDGKKEGTIVGFNNLYLYFSCNKCHSRVAQEKDYLCRRCDQKSRNPVPDFKFTVIIRNNDTLLSFTGFRNVLKPEDMSLGHTSVEEKLNERHVGKNATLTYMIQTARSGYDNEDNDDVIISIEY